MTTNTERVRYVETAPRLAGLGAELRAAARKVINGFRTFAQAFSAAQTAAHQASRYYAMSDAQLAKAGISRDRIAEELIRVLSR